MPRNSYELIFTHGHYETQKHIVKAGAKRIPVLVNAK
jgi:hypothetical protein